MFHSQFRKSRNSIATQVVLNENKVTQRVNQATGEILIEFLSD